MYIESALHQRGYYTSGNTVQRDIIRLRGQQRDIKHVKECLSELHLPRGSVPGGECAAEFPHRMELQSEDEGGGFVFHPFTVRQNKLYSVQQIVLHFSCLHSSHLLFHFTVTCCIYVHSL